MNKIIKFSTLSALILVSTFCSCQNKNYNNLKEENKNTNSMTTKENIFNDVMSKHLQYGANRNSFDIDDNQELEVSDYKFDLKELEVIDSIVFSILKSQGFKKNDNNYFSEKINQYFNRIIDYNSDNLFLSVNQNNHCDRQIKYSIYKRLEENFYISKKNNIINRFYFIPEIVDYLKLNQKYNSIENSINEEFEEDGMKIIVTRWKDVSDLDQQRKKNIETLVARNMYLFNDSKAHFKWLILNDETFMRSLVTTFGYYDDKELLKWVVENTTFDDDKPKALDELFWNKRCSGTVKINLEVFPILKEIIEPNDRNYFEALKIYVMYLLDEEKRNELSLQDRAKLLAHLVYFGEQYRYDTNFNDKSYFMQRIELYDIKGDIKKEIIKNNYYNLPNYQNLYKKSEEYQDALVDENGG